MSSKSARVTVLNNKKIWGCIHADLRKASSGGWQWYQANCKFKLETKPCSPSSKRGHCFWAWQWQHL